VDNVDNMNDVNDVGELEERFEKTIKAGEVLRQVREEVRPRIKPGVKLLEVAEFVENRIRELGAEPAFPVNISINADAAHFTPKKNDERAFKEGDLVKIDIGAHIDGFIADTAFTIDLGDHEELVKAAEDALKRAIEVVEPGIETSVIGAAIEEAIKEFDFRPIVNLTGHGFLPYVAHAPPTIYNFKTDRGVKVEEGMIFAIEPFATNGAGKVAERGEVEIYSVVAAKPTRMKMARELLKEVEKYKTLPFAKRWLTKAPEVILSKLVREGILRSYPVLTEINRGLVSQAEHTIIVESNRARIVT
jgi:methionyl aminopeptidase